MGKKDSRLPVPAPAPAPGDPPYNPLLSTLSPTPDATAAPRAGPLPQRPAQRYAAAQQAQDHCSASRYAPPHTRSQHGAREALSVDQLLPSIETPLSLPPTPYANQYRQYRQCHTRQARSATPRRTEQPVSPPLAPSPSKPYLEHANEQPARLAQPRKLLVLLDLNGTLLYRPRPDKAGRREHILRPGARELISYLFDNHAVMVYTSAMRRNAVLCVDALLKHLTPAQRNQLIGIHPREKLGLTPAQLNAKVQVYKPLKPVWRLKSVQASAKKHGCSSWDVTNTVLLDDSAEKARANPHNLLQVPEFKLAGDARHATANLSAATVKTETAIMQRVQARLEQLKWEVSAARRIRVWQEQKTTLVDDSDEDISTNSAAAAAAAAYPTPETTPGSDDNVDDNDNDNDDGDDDHDNDNDNDDDNDDDDDDDDDDEDGGVTLVFSDLGSSSLVPLERFRSLGLGQ